MRTPEFAGLTSNEYVNQVNIIMDSEVSKAHKASSLYKLGFTANEIEEIFAIFSDGVTAESIEEFVYTFGVEIECNVDWRTVTSDECIFEYRGYTHHDEQRVFKFVTDSSVQGVNAIECVTPVLNSSNDGMSLLKSCCKALNAQNARVNRSCGLHVHVGHPDLDGEWYVNVFKNYQKLEKAINTFMPESRRDSHWCKSIARFDFRNCHTPADVYSEMHDRYFAVNPMSWSRHKTIEFRQHAGSTNYTKISHWVRFCGKLLAWSKDNVLENEILTVNEIPFLDDSDKEYFNGRAEMFA